MTAELGLGLTFMGAIVGAVVYTVRQEGRITTLDMRTSGLEDRHEDFKSATEKKLDNIDHKVDQILTHLIERKR